MTLSTTLTPITPQNGPSHSGIHNALGTLLNAALPSNPVTVGTNWAGYPTPSWIQNLDGTVASPIIGNRPTSQVMRIENMAAPTNALDPGYSAGLWVGVDSLTNNKNQPTAIGANVQGYAESGNFCLGISSIVGHTGGAGGGGSAGYFQASSTVAGGAVQPITITCENLTGASVAFVSNPGSAIAGIDINYAATAADYGGAGIQIRASGGSPRLFDVGFATCIAAARTADFYAASSAVGAFVDVGTHTYGLDLSGGTYSGAKVKLDTTYLFGNISATQPYVQFDTSDFISYDRTGNQYSFNIAGVLQFFVTAAAMGFVNLPSVNPGAGTKQFWYDPAAGNVVKYAP